MTVPFTTLKLSSNPVDHVDEFWFEFLVEESGPESATTPDVRVKDELASPGSNRNADHDKKEKKDKKDKKDKEKKDKKDKKDKSDKPIDNPDKPIDNPDKPKIDEETAAPAWKKGDEAVLISKTNKKLDGLTVEITSVFPKSKQVQVKVHGLRGLDIVT